MDAIASSSAWRLAKALRGRPKVTPTRDGTAKYVRTDSDGTGWVQLPGSDVLTPVNGTTEVDAQPGQTVRWHIENGRLSITGNATAPAVGATYVTQRVAPVEATATQALVEAKSVRAELVEADRVIAGELEASRAEVRELAANSATVGDLAAATGRIGSLEAATADIAEVRANSAKVANLTAAQLEADHAKVSALDADQMAADHAAIGALDATYARVTLENVENSWIDKGVIRDAAISDAQIAGVSANKITAGTIDASKVNVTNLSAKSISVERINGVSVTGKSVADALAAAEGEIDGVRQDVSALDSKLDNAVGDLNARVDAQIETWTAKAVPTLSNHPASDWGTDKLKSEHVGDVCYVVNAASEADGYTYRFARDESSGTFGWVLIKDNQVTKALQELLDVQGDISGLQSFETEISSWKTDTDAELSSLKSSNTTLTTAVSRAITETTQLWFSKANTTAPAKPTAEVTSTSTAGNAWRAVVPAWNASYPNYFYCYQWKYSDGTFGWSAVTRDIAMGETQSAARTASSTATTAKSTADAAASDASAAKADASTAKTDAATAKTTAEGAATDAAAAKSDASTAKTDAATAKSDASTAKSTADTAKSTADTAKATADKNVRASIQLWFTKANETAPGKPTAKVTSNSTAGNAWRTVVPTYSATYPNYFYCWQYELADGTFTWSDVVFDRATTENEKNAHDALTQLTTKVETSTFNEVRQTVDSNSATITQLATRTDTALADSVEFVAGTQSAATSAWTGATRDASLAKGKTIAYHLPYAGTSTAATLDLTLSGGGTTGAKPVRLNSNNNANVNVTTHYGAGSVVLMTYDGSVWRCTNYDSGNTYDRVRYNSNVYAAAAVAANHLIAGTASGYRQLAASLAFDLSYPVLYARSAISAGASGTNNDVIASNVNYSTTGAVQSGAARRLVYLRGTVIGTTFTVAASDWLTTVAPTSEDGLFYMPLGVMSSATNGSFSSTRELWAFTGGRFQQASASVVTTANTVNEVRQTADSNSAKISSLETATDGLTSRMATAETSISQNRDAIALRATRAEVNADRRGLNLYVAANEVAGYLSTALAMVAPSATNLEVTSDFIPLLGASTFSVQTWLEQPKAMWLCYAFYADPTPEGYVTPASRPAKNATGTYLAYEGVAVPSVASYVRVSYRSYGIGRCKVEVDGLTAWSDAPADSDLYGTRAELRVASDEISTKVSKGEVISSINQSAEAVRIQAQRIELDGTAVFDSISSRVGGTVTDAQAVYWQAEGAAAPSVAGLAWVEYAGECVTYEGGGEDDEGEATRRWSAKPPTYSAAFPVTWVATQRRLLGGAVETSAPAMDDRITVIDGGRIVANSVTAESIDAESLLAEGAAVTVAIGTAIDAATATLATAGDVADVQSDLADATAALTEAIGSVGESADQVAGSVSELRGWVDIGSTADGDPALVMGKKDAEGAYDAATPLMRLTNRGLDIGVGDEALVQMLVEELEDGSRESVLRIMRAVIMGELRFGDYAFVARSNGNMTLKYVGDDDE